MFKALADLFGTRVVAVSEAKAIDETVESPELLAREAALKVFAESGHEVSYIMETPDGFVAVGTGGQSIFMGHTGGFQLVDTPETEPSDEGTRGRGNMFACPKCGWEGDYEDLRNGKCPECGYKFQMRESTDAPLTLDGLAENVETAMHEVEITAEVLDALRKFDAAKAADNMNEALRAVGLFEQTTGASVSRSQPLSLPPTPPEPGQPGSVKGNWNPSGDPYVPTPGAPPMPKKPLDVGPGPGKNTGTDGSTSGEIKVPTTDPPAPKPPKDVGTTKESVDEYKALGKLRAYTVTLPDKESADGMLYALEDWEYQVEDIRRDGLSIHFKASDMAMREIKKGIEKRRGKLKAHGLTTDPNVESVDIRVPSARVDEFIAVARKAGATDDVSVVREDDSFVFTLPKLVAEAVMGTFR